MITVLDGLPQPIAKLWLITMHLFGHILKMTKEEEIIKMPITFRGFFIEEDIL